MANIRTSSGRISAYGFACGYLESKPLSNGVVRLYQEHGTFHVKFVVDSHVFRWEVFNNLQKARKCYDQAEKYQSV